MRIIHPTMFDEIRSDKLVLSIEMFPGLSPPDLKLWVRFDEGKVMHFEDFGNFGQPSAFVFSEGFDLPPGKHRVEVRLGQEWQFPVSASAGAVIDFTLLSWENCPEVPSSISVVDAFSFFNEIEILKTRLLELSPVVDAFILVESDRTHSGQPKSTFFDPTDPAISPFAHKIVRVLYSPDMAIGTREQDMLQREEEQRNAIVRGLGTLDWLKIDSIIMVSDVDEIPKRGAVEKLRRCGAPTTVRMLMDWYLYSLDWASSTKWGLFAKEGSFAVRAEILQFATASQLRRSLRSKEATELGDIATSWVVMNAAGWHFSSFGGAEALRTKLVSYIGAADYGTSLFSEQSRLERLIRLSVLREARFPCVCLACCLVFFFETTTSVQPFFFFFFYIFMFSLAETGLRTTIWLISGMPTFCCLSFRE